MARLSEVIKKHKEENVIPEKHMKELSTCLFCHTEIKRGGCWSGSYHIGVCEDCATGGLIDLLIDTLEDTINFNKLSVEDRVNYLKNVCHNRILRKNLKNRTKDK